MWGSPWSRIWLSKAMGGLRAIYQHWQPIFSVQGKEESASSSDTQGAESSPTRPLLRRNVISMFGRPGTQFLLLRPFVSPENQHSSKERARSAPCLRRLCVPFVGKSEFYLDICHMKHVSVTCASIMCPFPPRARWSTLKPVSILDTSTPIAPLCSGNARGAHESLDKPTVLAHR
jgi:hypothetical protein